MNTINLYLDKQWEKQSNTNEYKIKGSTERLDETDILVNLPCDDVFLVEEAGTFKIFQVNTCKNMRLIGVGLV